MYARVQPLSAKLIIFAGTEKTPYFQGQDLRTPTGSPPLQKRKDDGYTNGVGQGELFSTRTNLISFCDPRRQKVFSRAAHATKTAER